MTIFKDKVHEEKISRLEDELDKTKEDIKKLDEKYSIKLVERIVFGFIGLSLTALGSAWIADVTGILEKLL